MAKGGLVEQWHLTLQKGQVNIQNACDKQYSHDPLADGIVTSANKGHC